MAGRQDDRSHEVHQLSPAGQVEQWGDLADGWLSNSNGRRRATRMLLGLAAVVLVVVAVVAVVNAVG